MSKLLKWAEVMKGKGMTVIDNTDTLPKDEDEFQIPDPAVVQNGKYKRTQVVPMSEIADTQARQDEVDAALERSKASHPEVSKHDAFFDARDDVPDHSNTGRPDESYEFDIEPSGEVPFADLAQAAQAPEIAEENAVVVEVEDKFSTPLSPMQWDDFVTEAQQQGVMPQDEVADFPTETPTVYVSLDVPEGVELVVKINGQEIL